MISVVSAPGKVLITGGYLVLDPQYRGTVVATNARFYTVVQRAEETHETPVIVVNSPQFKNGQWKYELKRDNGKVVLHPLSKDTNSYVQITLQHTFGLLEELGSLRNDSLTITIVGDNDFYSQRQHLIKRNLPLTSASLDKLPPFMPTGDEISRVHKTGLGSSAALITSLVAGLIGHYRNDTSATLDDLHNVAQFCHCLAQGKIGSGFDISAATFGSHIYGRFNSAPLAQLMDDPNPSYKETLIGQRHTWGLNVSPFVLPPGFELFLADISAGSATPGMVSKVLKWRKDNPGEAGDLWKELDTYNEKVTRSLLALAEYAKTCSVEEYEEKLSQCSTTEATTWKLTWPLLYTLHCQFAIVRGLLRKMSNLADVPIEPLSQTKLLDYTTSQPGVVMAGVPGAGGFDAIFVIAVSKEARERVEKMWSEECKDVCALSCHQGESGLRVEKLEDVRGLSDVVSSTGIDGDGNLAER